MIKGMTGFGFAQIETNKAKISVEIKTVNHRYLDISFYLPIGFGSLESKIRQIVAKELERGRVTISVKIIPQQTQTIFLNKEIVRTHLKYAAQIKKEFGLKNDLSLSDIIRLPGVLEIKENLLDADSLWPLLDKGMKKAIHGVVIMRNSEGKSLTVDLATQLKNMSAKVVIIQKRAKQSLAEAKPKMTDEEFRSFQKGTDVNEELSRLAHYIDEMKGLLKNGTSVGKKIDFIAQEMQRETNTIGSKLQDKVVANAVISLKSKIEKIREQSQNIE